MKRAVALYLAFLLGSAFLSSLLVVLVWGAQAAQAHATGVLVTALPQSWFVVRVFTTSPASAYDMYARFAGAETGKLLLVGVLFALVFSLWPSLAPAALFSGVVWMLLVQQIGGAVLVNKLAKQPQADPTGSSQQSP